MLLACCCKPATPPTHPTLQHPRIRAAPRPARSSIQATGHPPARRLILDAPHCHVLAHVPVRRRGGRSSPRRAAMSSCACLRATAEGGTRHAVPPCPPACAGVPPQWEEVGGQGEEGRKELRWGGERRGAWGGRGSGEEWRRAQGRHWRRRR
ncbi:hypothetical protein PVAP13_6NG199303 [Panicum virgatum]|uniref:Uncharacterized protein n=1 Tax=Panicum virgatum TaxID=38727 RepID=A0A8T0QWN0_PANVG|nr:hypothetical protein PVAP13_6NG199303 [Panicum virgatum]